MDFVYERMSYGNLIYGKYVVEKTAGKDKVMSALTDFLESVGERGMKPVELPFYYMEDMYSDLLRVHLFVKVDQTDAFMGDEKLQKYSYYGHDSVLSCRVTLQEMQNDMEAIFKKMEEKAVADEMTPYGPLYHCPSKLDGDLYYLRWPVIES